MNRVACAALLSTLLALSAAGQSVNWSQGIVYEYDGSGNVKKIGTDTYVYDTGQRLIRGSVAGSQQSYTYDSFGNRTGCQSGAGADCQYGLTINSSTNRISGRDYDNRGNLEQLPENNTLDYDELGMVRKETGNQRQAYFIYTADDERIAVYDADTQFNSHTWRWTVRGLDKKPLRELTSETSSGTVNFKWTKDQIWRDSVLLASRQLDPTASGGVSTYHYHVDHLGTPRQVTSSAAILIGRHDYLPFGPEVSGNQSEPQPQTLKFTGHERDFVRDHPPLDYMHARYYEGRAGRFLSVDPAGVDLRRPLSWNRYSYVLNNPVNLTDPTGRCVWDICIGEGALLWAAGAALAATATAYLNSESDSHSGRTNAEVMSSSISKASSATGSAIWSLISLSEGPSKTFDDLWAISRPGPPKSAGPSTIRDVDGGYDDAVGHFGDLILPGSGVDKGGGIIVGRLPDGRVIVVRPNSSDGAPTIEIQDGKTRIKFRFREKKKEEPKPPKDEEPKPPKEVT